MKKLILVLAVAITLAPGCKKCYSCNQINMLTGKGVQQEDVCGKANRDGRQGLNDIETNANGDTTKYYTWGCSDVAKD